MGQSRIRACRLLAVAYCLALPAMPARAAGFDCTRAASQVERDICADPTLSALDTEMARRYTDALALLPLGQSLRAGQREFLAARNAATGPQERRRAYEERLAELQGQIDAARAAAAEHDPAELARTCFVNDFEEADARCTVASSGPIAGAPGPALFFQVHNHDGAFERPDSGWVIAAAQPNGRLRPILWNSDIDSHFGAPALTRSPTGLLLEVPGSGTGTGVTDASSLFRFQDGKWLEIDRLSWLVDLGRRLPRGREVWKGVFPDWSRMTARTNLWIVGKDGNCCPTGGSAEIRLALQGDRIVLQDVRVSRRVLD